MAADDYFANNVLLLNCDGSNNSTVFTDDSSSHKSLTTNGNAKISTAIANPFGDYTGVAVFDGTGDFLNAAGSSDFAMDGGDFTIECWVNLQAYKAEGHFVALSLDQSVEVRLQQNSSNKLAAVIYHSGGYQVILNGVTTIPLSAWVHVCLVRYGNSHTIYLNGIAEASATVAHTIPAGSWQAYIAGVLYNSDAYRSNCYLYDVRVTKGIARYTANFSVQQRRFNAIYQIAINLTEELAATNFIAFVHELKNGIKRSVSTVTAGAKILYLTYKEPVIVTLIPEQGTAWETGTIYALNALVFPKNTTTTPYYYKRIAAGTSGSTEPSWSETGNDGLSSSAIYTLKNGAGEIIETRSAKGTANDGSVTSAWERVARLAKPISDGPLIPA